MINNNIAIDFKGQKYFSFSKSNAQQVNDKKKTIINPIDIEKRLSLNGYSLEFISYIILASGTSYNANV